MLKVFFNFQKWIISFILLRINFLTNFGFINLWYHKQIGDKRQAIVHEPIKEHLLCILNVKILDCN